MLRCGQAFVAPSRGNVINRFCVKNVHSSRAVKKAGKIDLVNADVGKIGTGYFHYLNLGLLAAFPAMVFAPAIISKPIELALCVAFPAHAHVAMNYVISDYIPRPFQKPARLGMLGATAIAILGLVKLSTTGPGLMNTMRALWKKPKPVEKIEA